MMRWKVMKFWQKLTVILQNWKGAFLKQYMAVNMSRSRDEVLHGNAVT